MSAPGQSALKSSTGAAAPALAVEGLGVVLLGEQGRFPVVADLSFQVGAGETLCIVGESGCGKTMTALALMRLQPRIARIAGGSVRINGENILDLSLPEVEDMRGDRIAMIFQEPMTSLNPVMRIGDQIAEVLRRHRGLSARAAAEQAVKMLGLVQMPDPAARARDFPHQLSGGMRQRAMIAMALTCEPQVLIADEPTTALDVTIQAQILALLRDLQKRFGMALILITHDLGVVAEMADRVLVMYAGRKVEEASAEDLFDHPLHPYTRRLMEAAPALGKSAGIDGRLQEIPGTVPPPWALPKGCAFVPRCSYVKDVCRQARPPLENWQRQHAAACFEAGRFVGSVL